MNRVVAWGALVALLAAAGWSCADETNWEAIPPVVVEQPYPFTAVDLTVRVAPDAKAEDIRRLTQVLVGYEGVAATEADYDGRVVRVVAATALTRSEIESLADRLREVRGVAAVE